MSNPLNEPPPPLPNHDRVSGARISEKLAPFMLTNFVVIGIGTAATIIALLFGNFEGKVIRTISTLVVFAAFTIFAAMDSKRKAPARYMMIAQVGHMYMLGLSLILIWGSLSSKSNSFQEFSIFTDMLIIIAIVKAGILVIQKVSDAMHIPHQWLNLVAKWGAISIALTSLLYTLPFGTDFLFTFGEAYWKLSIAVLVFSACALSMTIMLAWQLREDDDDDEATAPPVQRAQSAGSTAPLSDMQVVGRTSPRNALSNAPQLPPSHPASPSATTVATEYLRPVSGPQPWPVFPNGQPLPATQSGRPDYAVLQYVASVHAETERQWFGG